MMIINPNYKIKFLLTKLLLLAFFFAQNIHAQNIPLDKIAAIVNDDVVMFSEVKSTALQMRSAGSKLSGKSLLKDSLENLVLEKVQLQRAKQIGIKIDNVAVNKAMLSIATQNNLDLEQFRVALAKEGLDYKTFRNTIREKLYLETLRKRQLGRNNKISESEVDDLIQSESISLNKDVEYHIMDILVPAQNGLSVPQFNQRLAQANNLRKRLIGRPDLTVQQLIKKAKASQKDLGWKSTKALSPAYIRTLSLIEAGELSSVVRDATGFHILKLIEKRGGKRKITKQARVRHILIPSSDPKGRFKATILRNKILAGENFATLAKANSADKGSAKKGGNLDFTNPASFVPPFAAAVRTLPLNSLSQPIQTQFGWHIIEVLERKSTDQTRESLKQQAENLISKSKRSEDYKSWLQSLMDQAFIEYRL